jgi:hypothetical protein
MIHKMLSIVPKYNGGARATVANFIIQHWFRLLTMNPSFSGYYMRRKGQEQVKSLD